MQPIPPLVDGPSSSSSYSKPEAGSEPLAAVPAPTVRVPAKPLLLLERNYEVIMALPPPLLHGGGTLLTGRRARGRVFFTASPPPPLARQPLEFYTSGSRHAGRRAHRRAPFLAAGSWRQKSITKASRAAPSCVAFASPSGEHQPPGKCQAKPSQAEASPSCPVGYSTDIVRPVPLAACLSACGE